jgi:hypothetical protein
LYNLGVGWEESDSGMRRVDRPPVHRPARVRGHPQLGHLERRREAMSVRETGIGIKTFVDRGIRRWCVTRDGKALAYFYGKQEAEDLANAERARDADPMAHTLDALLDKEDRDGGAE